MAYCQSGKKLQRYRWLHRKALLDAQRVALSDEWGCRLASTGAKVCDSLKRDRTPNFRFRSYWSQEVSQALITAEQSIGRYIFKKYYTTVRSVRAWDIDLELQLRKKAQEPLTLSALVSLLNAPQGISLPLFSSSLCLREAAIVITFN